MKGILYIENFIHQPDQLFHFLVSQVEWDGRMAARKTASFGEAYNYSQMEYPFQEFLPELEAINLQLVSAIGFKPNNCLINYYLDGRSKMGWHSDETKILEDGTGIAIVSVGETRTLQFRSKQEPSQFIDYPLPAGSLIYMTQEVQDNWQHSIPRSDTDHGRISLTFRKMR
ncbi:MAG: alpha-ketoglutarate-dependent dioxygenase AlkB [Chitinophagaceae bacterium]|nr:alpha-ketoglutarate-dependent dioxygenase AlkB [Chitinophagaceae bacterium]